MTQRTASSSERTITETLAVVVAQALSSRHNVPASGQQPLGLLGQVVLLFATSPSLVAFRSNPSRSSAPPAAWTLAT